MLVEKERKREKQTLIFLTEIFVSGLNISKGIYIKDYVFAYLR